MNLKAFLFIHIVSFIFPFVSHLEVVSLFDLIEGLETVEAVKIDENGVIYIFYLVTDEFMEEYDLDCKQRVFEISGLDLTFISYEVQG